ncbi:hypothetical protein EW145_g8245 [Phellinidium pouzarii]|uniref:Uncharacterized protein n=1 Tax=Phellinidium pouzarii TaxID=167371 RepID=A0A4S4K7W9_9AGAM|nr:hypothetical protein EW145_g8245 [Phellinidium pouzarii]
MSLANKLLCRIFGSSGSQSTDSNDKNSQSTNDADADARNVLKQFIAKSPNASYTFDSERNAPQSELCRNIQDDTDAEHEALPGNAGVFLIFIYPLRVQIPNPTSPESRVSFPYPFHHH